MAGRLGDCGGDHGQESGQVGVGGRVDVGALLVVAGVLALYMLGLLLFAAVWAFSLIMPLWAAFLVVSGILLVIIAGLVVIGGIELKKANDVAVNPVTGLKASTDAAKKGFQDE